MASISLSSNTKSAKRPGSIRPAVVFPPARSLPIGRGLPALTRGNTLIPEQDTAVADAVYRRVHTAEGGHRKDGRIHMQREGISKRTQEPGGVHTRGALGPRKMAACRSPQTSMCRANSQDDPQAFMRSSCESETAAHG